MALDLTDFEDRKFRDAFIKAAIEKLRADYEEQERRWLAFNTLERHAMPPQDAELVNPFPECWHCGGRNDNEPNANGKFYVHCGGCRKKLGRESGIFLREPPYLHGSLNVLDLNPNARLDIPFVSTVLDDPEWPSVLYENDNDFFDDNQMIDAKVTRGTSQ